MTYREKDVRWHLLNLRYGDPKYRELIAEMHTTMKEDGLSLKSIGTSISEMFHLRTLGRENMPKPEKTKSIALVHAPKVIQLLPFVQQRKAA